MEIKLDVLRSKKQKIVFRSSVEANYHAIAKLACEISLPRQLLQQLKFGGTQHTELMQQSNSILHMRAKHMGIDCHFVRKKVHLGEIITNFDLQTCSLNPLRDPVLIAYVTS